MVAPIQMTARRRELLVTLTHKVRFLTVPQVARTWFSESKSDSPLPDRELRALEEAGFIKRTTLVLHPEIELAAPVVSWAQGKPEPHVGKVAYRLQSRWTKANVAALVFYAAPAAKKRFGGFSGAPKHVHQGTHDSHVAALFCRLLRLNPAEAHDWVSEELLPKPERAGDKLPDAVLRRPTGEVYRVIEFGSAYDAARVAKFHRYCAANSLPYELW